MSRRRIYRPRPELRALNSFQVRTLRLLFLQTNQTQQAIANLFGVSRIVVRKAAGWQTYREVF